MATHGIDPQARGLAQQYRGSGGSALVGYLPGGTGAVATTVQTRLRKFTTLEDYGGGTAMSGATNATAFAAALVYLAGGGEILLESGNYNLSLAATLTLPGGVSLTGTGKTSITRTDATAYSTFTGTNTVGRNHVHGIEFIGNNVATDYLNGAIFYFEQNASAAADMQDICFSNCIFRNCKGDGWLTFIQTGEVVYDLRNIRVEGSCSFFSTTGGCRGPTDLGIPSSAIWLQGYTGTVATGRGRVKDVYIGSVTGNLKDTKGLIGIYNGVDGVTIDRPVIDAAGTVGIGSDKGGYFIAIVNEIERGPNPNNIRIIEPVLKAGMSAGVYTAVWGNTPACYIYFRQRDGGYFAGITDTADTTLPKGCIATTDTNSTWVIDGLDARQCYKALDLPLGVGQSLDIDGVRYVNVAASVEPKAGQNTGKSVFNLDPLAPVQAGYTAGVYSVRVTSGGASAAPTFTIYDPAAASVGTYVPGDADFSTQIKFSIGTRLGANPIATTNTSTTVTITHAGHNLTPGSIVSINRATAVGGITLAGNYTVQTVTDINAYTITAGSAATSTATGGGSNVWVGGISQFATSDEFKVTVEANQPAAAATAINISKQDSTFNVGPSGPIRIGDVYCRNHGSSGVGIRIRGESGASILSTYGKITFNGHLDIECIEIPLKMWGENSSTKINPYTQGVYFLGTGTLRSQSNYTVAMRAIASRVVWGGSYVMLRSTDTANPAYGMLMDYMSDLNVAPGSLTITDRGAHASDGLGWDASSGSVGTIGPDGVKFLRCATSYRASGLGTAVPSVAPVGGGDGAYVFNLTPTNAGGFNVTGWRYVGFAWYTEKATAV